MTRTIKYEIKRWGKDRIAPVVCTKETEKSLWIETEWMGRVSTHRRLKCSDFHDTWQQAHDFLVKQAHQRIESAERTLQKAKADLAAVEALVAPTEEPQP